MSQVSSSLNLAGFRTALPDLVSPHFLFQPFACCQLMVMKSDHWLDLSHFLLHFEMEQSLANHSLLRLPLLVSACFCFICTVYAHLWLCMILELGEESPPWLSLRYHWTASWLDRQLEMSTGSHSLSRWSRISAWWLTVSLLCSLELPWPGCRSLDVVGSIVFERQPRNSWAGEHPVSRGLFLMSSSTLYGSFAFTDKYLTVCTVQNFLFSSCHVPCAEYFSSLLTYPNIR